jgi:hypothetical protein
MSVIAIVAVTLPAPWSAAAGEIRISGDSCGTAVHLVARDASLSDVLKRLAKALDFELVGDADGDSPITVDVVRRPVDLVAGLAGLDNISMTLEQNPRCPRRERIVKLWVLPGGHRQGPSAHPSNADAEQARRAQEGIDMVLRAHGMPTTGAEAAKRR